ncbi:ABC transporter permease [Halopseudomonas pelagia]|uniref:ABC transporter permease n=1 Tax=Halopseudomonas pelagia TaxID=553151 RepID=UPI0003A9D686|nr:ABC transporter permease [Halopseudomonas pelagia]|tara:strand:- start:282 stop:1043 length:762 start_codon:yes stop_codon:yes gene_type:complete
MRKMMMNASPWLFFTGLILLWELVCQLFELPAYVLPAPSAIGAAFFEVEMSRWLDHLWATLRVALMGFALSIAISIPLAIVMMRSELLSRTLYPLLVVIQATPVVAVAPLIIVMMGSDDPSRVLITCLLTFFPLVVSTATGINETPPELIELSRSLDAPTRRETWQIRIPYAIPHIFSGLKVAITLAIIGAVVAEFVAAEKGLGYFIQFSTSFFKIPQAFAGLFFLAAVSLLLFKSVQWTQQIFFAWSLPKKK